MNILISVAEIEKQIVGFSLGKLILIRNNILFVDQNIGEVLYVVVKEEFKKKGIAKALMNYLENSLKGMGANKLELKVYNFNKEVIPESVGFMQKFTIYEKGLNDS